MLMPRATAALNACSARMRSARTGVLPVAVPRDVAVAVADRDDARPSVARDRVDGPPDRLGERVVGEPLVLVVQDQRPRGHPAHGVDVEGDLAGERFEGDVAVPEVAAQAPRGTGPA